MMCQMAQKCVKDPKGAGCNKLEDVALEKSKKVCSMDEPCVKEIMS